MSDKKIFETKPLSFFTSKNISISFIIHVKNQFYNSSFILESILNCKNPFEVILVNDNSLNKEYFAEITNTFKFLKLINNNLKHSDAINSAIEYCENNWIFYINSDFVPHNSMWLNGIINSMMNLKLNNIKLISPIIKDLSFFKNYGKEKQDVVLTDHFLPFNVTFFHRDLFRSIGKLDSSDDVLEISKNFYFKMNKKGFKQAICVSSIFA